MNDSTPTNGTNNSSANQSIPVNSATDSTSATPPSTKGESSSSQRRIKNFVFTKKQQHLWIVLLAIFSLVLIGAGAYGYGYTNGHKRGKTAGERKSANPFNKFASPFKVQTGKITKIDGNKLTLHSSQGQVVEIKLTDKTKVTRKTDQLKTSDLAKDKKVTIFMSSTGDEATRIVLRD